jgi:nicotinate-nucleotide--dimethylbenzimidazole phosphoribosyltransferase
MEGIRHKYDVLSQAISNYHKYKSDSQFSTLHSIPEQSSPTRSLSLFTLSYFGGFEMVAAIGAMLRAAEQHLVILVDGFIMTACALAAIQLEPKSRDYMIFTHSGDEVGHRKMLDAMGASPLVSLGLRLGEGTGALCAFPIVDSAVRMVNEMNNFQNASITKYF